MQSYFGEIEFDSDKSDELTANTSKTIVDYSNPDLFIKH